MLLKFWNDQSGATAIEYGLIATLLSMMVLAGAKLNGSALDELYNAIVATLRSACDHADVNSQIECTKK